MFAAGIMLLAAVGMPILPRAGAQSSSAGSLAGKLTDLHSRPVDRATLILRNTATGAEALTTTSKNGSYRFAGLAPGEYTLVAGNGRLEGISITAGHEARVQAALDLGRSAPTPVEAIPHAAAGLSDLATRPSDSISPMPVAATRSMPRTSMERPSRVPVISLVPETGLVPEPIENPTVIAKTAPSAEPGLPSAAPQQPAFSGPPLGAAPAAAAFSGSTAAAQKTDLPTVALYVPPPGPIESLAASNLEITPAVSTIAPNSLLFRTLGSSLAIAAASTAQAQLHPAPFQVLAARAIMPESVVPATALTGEELQTFPLSGRRWENLVQDTPAASAATNDDSQPETHRERQGAAFVVDGVSTRLAFGGHAGGRLHSSSLMGPGTNELGISEVRTISRAGGAQYDLGALSHVDTRRGTQAFHGQAFFFDRQNFLGAQNPFTQWVKETAPATSITVPVFTPIPYTAPDTNLSWGLGLGSRIPHTRLVWFAALDGAHRENPGVSSVKHPDDFFAQPSNDEMQVLSARLGLSSANPVVEGLSAYSGMLETLSGLLGPASRGTDQWTGSTRIDWKASERHSFTLEGAGARWDSPGGGLTRTAETYGNHSYGAGAASEYWFLGRWQVFSLPEWWRSPRVLWAVISFPGSPGRPPSLNRLST